MTRMTWLDESGVRHLISRRQPGCVCGQFPEGTKLLHDDVLYTGVDEGDHVVTCVECMAGEDGEDGAEDNASDSDLLSLLEASVRR